MSEAKVQWMIALEKAMGIKIPAAQLHFTRLAY